MAGIKDDKEKVRMDLIPTDSLRDLAEVYTMGARKYADENWREGIAWKRIYGAILRHITSWYLGEDTDPESGLSHLAHAAWGCFTLLNYRRTHPEFDNRPRAKGAGLQLPLSFPPLDEQPEPESELDYPPAHPAPGLTNCRTS